MATRTHAFAGERTERGYTVRCRCGWTHDAPTKAGIVEWYRQHLRVPELTCPAAPNVYCNQHGQGTATEITPSADEPCASYDEWRATLECGHTKLLARRVTGRTQPTPPEPWTRTRCYTCGKHRYIKTITKLDHVDEI